MDSGSPAGGIGTVSGAMKAGDWSHPKDEEEQQGSLSLHQPGSNEARWHPEGTSELDIAERDVRVSRSSA